MKGKRGNATQQQNLTRVDTRARSLVVRVDSSAQEHTCVLFVILTGGRERQRGSETPGDSGVTDLRSRPRDSGCHMPSDCSDNGRDDSEINFLNVSSSSPTPDQISAV